MTPEDAFDDLAASMAGLGAEQAKMMGRPMLRIGQRMFACLDRGVLGLRLGVQEAAFAAAIALPGATVFMPAGSITFRDWVALPVDQAEHWERFAASALRYAAEHAPSASSRRAR